MTEEYQKQELPLLIMRVMMKITSQSLNKETTAGIVRMKRQNIPVQVANSAQTHRQMQMRIQVWMMVHTNLRMNTILKHKHHPYKR